MKLPFFLTCVLVFASVMFLGGWFIGDAVYAKRHKQPCLESAIKAILSCALGVFIAVILIYTLIISCKYPV